MAEDQLPVPYKALAPALRDRLASAGLALATSLTAGRVFEFGPDPIGTLVVGPFPDHPAVLPEPGTGEWEEFIAYDWGEWEGFDELVAVDQVEVPHGSIAALRLRRPIRRGQLARLGATPDTVDLDGEAMVECLAQTCGPDMDWDHTFIAEALDLDGVVREIASWPVPVVCLGQIHFMVQPDDLSALISHPARRGIHLYDDNVTNAGLAAGLDAAVGLEHLTLDHAADPAILNVAGRLPCLRSLEFADSDANLIAGLVGFAALETLTVSALSGLVDLDPATNFPRLNRLHLWASTAGVDAYERLIRRNLPASRPEPIDLALTRPFAELARLYLHGFSVDRTAGRNLGRTPGLTELRQFDTVVEPGTFDEAASEGGFRDLEILYLWTSPIDREDVAGLGVLAKLHDLKLYRTDLPPGALAAAIQRGGFKSLRTLRLNALTLAPEDVHSLGRLDNMHDLVLFSLPPIHELERAVPPALESLEIGYAPAAAAMLARLAGHPALRRLRLFRCAEVTDDHADAFAALPALDTLEVVRCGATELLAERLALLRPEVSVHVDVLSPDPRLH